jgi:hypothetical protein
MNQSNSHLHWDAAELTAGEILRRAHDLVAFGWCQGADATDAAGHPVELWSVHACHWSLLGALAAALGTPAPDTPEPPELICRATPRARRDQRPDPRLVTAATGTTTPHEHRTTSSRRSQAATQRQHPDLLAPLTAQKTHPLQRLWRGANVDDGGSSPDEGSPSRRNSSYSGNGRRRIVRPRREGAVALGA